MGIASLFICTAVCASVITTQTITNTDFPVWEFTGTTYNNAKDQAPMTAIMRFNGTSDIKIFKYADPQNNATCYILMNPQSNLTFTTNLSCLK